MGVPALSAARVLPVDHAAVVQGFLAVAQSFLVVALKHVSAAWKFLAVVEKHAAAAQKYRATAAKHAAVAQACHAADLSAVAGMLPPPVLAAASGGLPASNHGVPVHVVISHHAPIHVAANHCAVAGGLLAVLNNGAVAAVDHNGAVPEDLHASDHAVSEIGAVVWDLHAPQPAAVFQTSPVLNAPVAVPGLAPSLQEDVYIKIITQSCIPYTVDESMHNVETLWSINALVPPAFHLDSPKQLFFRE